MTFTALEARSFGHGDHVCLLFDSAEELRRAAVRFLAEGAARGERLLYVADAPHQVGLLAQLSDLADANVLVARGQLELTPAQSLYRPYGGFDVEAQVDRYRVLTEAALADGFTGFRVAADATALVTDPHDRQTFLEYELAVDRYIAGAAMAAMCAYDTSVLGDDAAELACVHRERHTSSGGRDVGFALYAVGDRLVMEGELDIANRSPFKAVLRAAAAGDGDVVIDLSSLAFADVGAVRELVALRRRLSPRRVVVDDPRGVLHRVADAVGWPI